MLRWLKEYFYGPDDEEIEGLYCVYEIYRDPDTDALVGHFVSEGELAKKWEPTGGFALPIVGEDVASVFAKQAAALQARDDLPV